MLKNIIFLAVVVVLISFMRLGFVSAEQMHADHPQEMQAKEADLPVNVGNTICPVSGEKINEKTKVTYEYEGKIYNFCCPMCIDSFKKDPDKYIKIIEAEKLEKEKKEKANEPSETHEHEHMHH